MWESYYSAQVVRGFFASFDLQRVTGIRLTIASAAPLDYSIRLHLAGALRIRRPAFFSR